MDSVFDSAMMLVERTADILNFARRMSPLKTLPQKTKFHHTKPHIASPWNELPAER
jgi:hypothetical protein